MSSIFAEKKPTKTSDKVENEKENETRDYP